MLNTLIRRLIQMVFVMFGISVIVFLIFFWTPGADPAARIAGRNASPEVLAAVRHDFGFDRPLYVQYGIMMKKLLVTYDLTSFQNRGQKVVPQLVQATPVTLSLVIGGAVLWVIGGIFVGLVAAATKGSVLDRGLMMFSCVPALGYKPLLETPWEWFKTMLIPWVSLAVLYIGLYGRVLRASLIEANEEDYIRTARSKGLTETRILFRHALRTSLVTFVTLFGLDFGALVGGGALLTEVVFGLQGVGKLTYDSLKSLDLPVILASVIYASFFVVGANFVVDMAYAILDPRVRGR
jgi:peptide/nickel transport system permease protein